MGLAAAAAQPALPSPAVKHPRRGRNVVDSKGLPVIALFAAAILVLPVLTCAAADRASPASIVKRLQDRADEIQRRYQTDLSRLAEWADRHGLRAEAAATRARCSPSPDGTLALGLVLDRPADALPAESPTPAPS